MSLPRSRAFATRRRPHAASVYHQQATRPISSQISARDVVLNRHGREVQDLAILRNEIEKAITCYHTWEVAGESLARVLQNDPCDPAAAVEECRQSNEDLLRSLESEIWQHLDKLQGKLEAVEARKPARVRPSLAPNHLFKLALDCMAELEKVLSRCRATELRLLDQSVRQKGKAVSRGDSAVDLA